MTPERSLRWLLDPNVIAELCRKAPTQDVVTLFGQHQHEVAIPAVVWQELLYGALRMPAGRRQSDLLEFIHRVAGSLPRLAYDTHAATLHAQIRANAAAAGRPLAEPDAHIAAIALANNLTLATRNTRDFQGIDSLVLANWFEPTTP